MKVIDKRKKVKTYSVGDWFEYNSPYNTNEGLCQLIFLGENRMALTVDHKTICNVSIDIPKEITREHLNRLSQFVGKKVNVEIHIVSDAE